MLKDEQEGLLSRKNEETDEDIITINASRTDWILHIIAMEWNKIKLYLNMSVKTGQHYWTTMINE